MQLQIQNNIEMSSYLNQIFYKSNKFDNPDKLINLLPYMLSCDLIKKIKHNSINIVTPEKENNTIEKIILTKEPENKNVFFPQRENSLFWCIYISKYGLDEFLYNKKSTHTIEIEEKHKVIEYLKKNPRELKNSNHKITNIMIQEINSDVMSLSKPSLLSVFGYALFYKKNFFILNNKTYYSFLYNKEMESTDENIVIINYNNESGLFGIDTLTTMEKVTHIKNNLVGLESIEKPLRGLSAYKVCELEDYARKLNIFSDINLKKKDLYDKIVDACYWDENIFIEKKRK